MKRRAAQFVHRSLWWEEIHSEMSAVVGEAQLRGVCMAGEYLRHDDEPVRLDEEGPGGSQALRGRIMCGEQETFSIVSQVGGKLCAALLEIPRCLRVRKSRWWLRQPQ